MLGETNPPNLIPAKFYSYTVSRKVYFQDISGGIVSEGQNVTLFTK